MSAPGKTDNPSLDAATQLVHGGTLRSGFGETSEALFLTQGFVYPNAEAAEARFCGDDDGFVYSRYANPTVAMFEERMRLFEGSEAAMATASGMAAVHSSLMSFLRAGDHIVAAKALFGSCRYIVEELAPRFGIETTLIDGTKVSEWEAAIRPNTKACFFESPTNPTLDVIDIAAVSALAHAVGAKVIIDNVFATPLWQRPLDLGADVVVYSATKHIDGQGRCLGGIILGTQDYIDKVFAYNKHTGPSLSPFNAWVLLKGLETLTLRVERQTETAGRIFDALVGHKALSRAIYPGSDRHPQRELIKRQMKKGSTMLALELNGGKEAAFAFCNALQIIKISNNLGDAKSLVTHPATTTHQRLNADDRAELGISDGLVRLSVGLEAVSDLITDLDRALDVADRVVAKKVATKAAKVA
ncbi:MAG: O-succinylhomoserine sulfhydrylase [Rhizobiales bacterium]|nr:O-succinylhomoserine sulfhydrylase [Hyphomicrobiales bacterium]